MSWKNGVKKPFFQPTSAPALLSIDGCALFGETTGFE
jgi:hypothetical protein